mmetsp:Transcript_3790/g.10056  ORF Transcript_3790/g.10056 Transcript_3790/m.10056 type:complete len:94 (-) Transcript_3790:152-433(-)
MGPPPILGKGNQHRQRKVCAPQICIYITAQIIIIITIVVNDVSVCNMTASNATHSEAQTPTPKKKEKQKSASNNKDDSIIEAKVVSSDGERIV